MPPRTKRFVFFLSLSLFFVVEYACRRKMETVDLKKLTTFRAAVLGMWWGFAIVAGSLEMLARACDKSRHAVAECAQELERVPGVKALSSEFANFVRKGWGFREGLMRVKCKQDLYIIIDRKRKHIDVLIQNNRSRAELLTEENRESLKRLLNMTSQRTWMDCESSTWTLLQHLNPRRNSSPILTTSREIVTESATRHWAERKKQKQ
jgi:hypothetical protein